MSFANWDDVVAFAQTLPDVYLENFYGKPAPKVNKKAFVTPGSEPGSFVAMSTNEEKSVLLETDPDTFWQTPHYDGWSSLLVRYGSTDTDRIAAVITRAWWDRASAAQRKAFGDRP